jgi:energy-converting hydrogenase Eha subunit G
VLVHQICAHTGRHGKTKKTSACWVFAFIAHTLAATDWLITLIVAGGTTSGLYMVPEWLMVLMF